MGNRKVLIGLLSAIGAVVAAAIAFVSLALSGTLPVLKNKIEIQSMTYTKVYDGTAADSDSYEITSGTLYSGDALDVTFTTTATDVGTYTNEFNVKIKNSKGHDVTSNYDITKTFGKLTITSRSLTLKVKDESEPYNGQKLTASEYEFVDNNLVEGETLEVYYEGEITDVGETTASLIPHIYTADRRDVTSNYKITTVDGTLIKTAISLTMTSKSLTKTYDGTELRDDSTEPTMEGTLSEGDVLTYETTASITDVGEVENEFNATISEDGKDVTYRYTIHKNYGKLTVNALPVTYKSCDHLGEAYTGTSYSYTGEELAQESTVAPTDSLTITYTGKYTNAGTYSNKFYVSIRNQETGIDASANYKITIAYGTIEILPKEITLKTVSASKTYDGNITDGWDSVNGIIQSYSLVGELAPGQTPSASFQKISADCGTYRNLASLRIFDAENQNVTSNYDISYDYGDLTILKRSITVQASSASKEKDGEPLTSPEWYWISGSTAENEYLVCDVTGSITEVGTADNTLSWRITDEDGTELSNANSNYDVTIIKGILHVYDADRKSCTIVPKDNIMSLDEFVALGTGEMTSTGVLGFESYALDGYELTCSFDAKLEGAGSKTVGIVASSVKVTKMVAGSPQDVTENFDFTFGTGYLRVYREKFVISTSDATKTYDGTALSNKNITMTEAGVSSDTGSIAFTQNGVDYVLSYADTSSQTAVGKSLNRINVTGLTIDGASVSEEVLYSEYYFSVSAGTLEVTRRTLEVTTASASAVKSKDVTSVSASELSGQIIGELAAGDTAYVKKSYILSSVGTAENKIEIGIKNSNGEDVTDYYIINYTYGVLELKAN